MQRPLPANRLILLPRKGPAARLEFTFATEKLHIIGLSQPLLLLFNIPTICSLGNRECCMLSISSA